MQGSLYGVSINGEFIPCELSCELTINREMINKTGSWSGKAKAFRYGYYDWSISCDGKTMANILQSSTSSLIDAQINGIILDVFIEARVSNVKQFKTGGKVLIPALSVSFPNTGASTFNVTFQGTGDLISDFDLWTIIDDMPANADKPEVVNMTNW